MFKSKIFIVLLLLMNIFSPAANAYQTALITYPDYNKNWKQIYFGKQYDETISQWIPAYSYQNDWTESVVFHAYNWAKGNNCYKFMSNLLASVASQKYNNAKHDYKKTALKILLQSGVSIKIRLCPLSAKFCV